MSETNTELKPDFGDYCTIEQKRYGCDNEFYTHKVITRSNSNSWVDAPVKTPAEEIAHDHMEEVVWCICCGVNEREVRKYRLSDVKITTRKFPETRTPAIVEPKELVEYPIKPSRDVVWIIATDAPNTTQEMLSSRRAEYIYSQLREALSQPMQSEPVDKDLVLVEREALEYVQVTLELSISSLLYKVSEYKKLGKPSKLNTLTLEYWDKAINEEEKHLAAIKLALGDRNYGKIKSS